MPLKSLRVRTVERELGFELHPQYAAFLDRHGTYYSDGMEVYGYFEDFISIDGYPCVIFTSLKRRDMFSLRPQDLLIAHTVDSDFVAVLENETGRVVEVNFDGYRTLVANSFDEWFAMVRKRGYI